MAESNDNLKEETFKVPQPDVIEKTETITEVVEEAEVEEEVEMGISNTTSIPPASLSTKQMSVVTGFEDVSNTVAVLEQLSQLAKVLIKSNLCPLKKEEDVILAVITGAQYGLPYMTSINQIVPIQGKPTLSAHLHRALILKHGIHFECIYSYEPMYDWAEVGEDGNIKTQAMTGNNNQVVNVPIIIKRSTMQERPTIKCIASQAVDRITKYRFTREIIVGKTRKTITVNSEYKISDATRAGLIDKDNYVKHTPRMLDARAFTAGTREIAADITLGIYSLNELADEHNIPYAISENLEETLLIKE